MAAARTPGAPEMALKERDEMSRFSHYSDARLIEFWNEQDGGLSWLMELEDTLKALGYVTRGENGKSICIPNTHAQGQ